MRRLILIAYGVFMLDGLPSSAQPVPGTEFLVNSYTTSVQSIATVASDKRGRFVVLWQSEGQDGDRSGMFASRFDRLGRARGPEIAVNQVTADNQLIGSVASDAGGNFIACWRRSEPTQPTTLRVVGRLFDRAGSPLTPEFAVSDATTNARLWGWAAMQPDGRFLIAWTGAPGVVGRHFAASGTPVGAEFALSTATGIVDAVRASAAPDGGYLVTWSRSDATGHNVYARRIGAAGLPAGAEFRVNSFSAGYEHDATSSFDDSGGFVVAWDKGPNGIDVNAFARRFDSGGAPIGGDFQVNDDTTRRHCCAKAVSDRDGGFTVLWTGGDFDFDVYARRFGPSGAALESEFRVPFDNTYWQYGGAAARAPGGHLLVTYTSDVADGDGRGVLGRLLGIVPMALTVDAAPVSSNGNGVLEPGETVAVRPAWANADHGPLVLTGALSGFVGPGPSTYTIVDGAGAYGTVPFTATASCADTGDCYVVAVSAPPARPALHWDAEARERLAPRGDMTWSLHVGGSFVDVGPSNVFYRFVETLLHHGVAAGCGADTYCPAAAATREQMSALVLVAHEGSGYRPPACQLPLFADVPAASPFCRFVEELSRRGVVAGCGGGNFCPAGPVTREQMAVFVLRTIAPAFTPPACTAPLFADVPASSPFCPWIEELARRGVVSGCGGGNFCPTAPVTRDQMAVFISAGFGLDLYGP